MLQRKTSFHVRFLRLFLVGGFEGILVSFSVQVQISLLFLKLVRNQFSQSPELHNPSFVCSFLFEGLTSPLCSSQLSNFAILTLDCIRVKNKLKKHYCQNFTQHPDLSSLNLIPKKLNTFQMIFKGHDTWLLCFQCLSGYI